MIEVMMLHKVFVSPFQRKDDMKGLLCSAVCLLVHPFFYHENLTLALTLPFLNISSSTFKLSCL